MIFLIYYWNSLFKTWTNQLFKLLFLLYSWTCTFSFSDSFIYYFLIENFSLIYFIIFYFILFFYCPSVQIKIKVIIIVYNNNNKRQIRPYKTIKDLGRHKIRQNGECNKVVSWSSATQNE